MTMMSEVPYDCFKWILLYLSGLGYQSLVVTLSHSVCDNSLLFTKGTNEIPIYTSPEITSFFTVSSPGSVVYSGDTITANIGVNVGTTGQFYAFIYIYNNTTLGGQV